MESELRRVLAHPGLGLNSWDEEVTLRVIKVIQLVFDIDRMVRKHKLTLQTCARKGFLHYKECLWANPNAVCGPDTCICSHIGFKRYRIKLLLDEIEVVLKSSSSVEKCVGGGGNIRG